ncbi:beta-klotho [Myxocyprinus asiaticus]|uniref:beta-klotho n=1 Tax=Myxocyprinus asiaticus TaxID=70543 RepID=UPI002223DA4A|nr:beta-klotho [Myxocyprinus asiaticus]
MESSLLAEVIKTLAGIHQIQHQALLELRVELEQWFQVLFQAQAEDRQVLRSFVHQEGSSATTPGPPMAVPIVLTKMGMQDNLEAFIELFERTAEVWKCQAPSGQSVYCRCCLGKPSSWLNFLWPTSWSLSLWGTTECSLLGKGHKLWLQPLNRTNLQFGTFPNGFLWGVGTSAFPTEGSWDADGKGESVWDHFTHHSQTDGIRMDTADTASDSYIQWEEDVKSVQYLGVKFYAFSLSWPRLFPDGNATAKPNEAGVRHYRRLIGKLKELHVEPVVTLFHWDLPQVLQERFGGWLNQNMVGIFADYATFCFKTFGGEVRYWLTMHNPFLLAIQGYGTGAYAPGVTGDRADPFIAAHNLIRAHAKVWHIYDKHFRHHQHGKISITFGSHWVKPAHGQATPANVELCQKSMEAVIGWFAEPIHGSGDYPASLKVSNRGVIPEFTPEERVWVRGTADFFSLAFGSETLRVVRGLARFGQNVTLDLRSVLVWIQQAYRDPQVLVAESGWFSDASVGVEDTVAIYLIKTFIIQVLQAVSIDSVNVFGYTAWSLVDGFEWNQGYSKRRGLFYIDFSRPQCHRLPKTTAHFYRQVVKDNGFPTDNASIEGRFPCDFHFGVADSILQVHLRPFSPQFTDPHLYRWNYSGDGALKPIAGIMLHTRGAQCTDFLFIQRHLFLLGVTGSTHYRFVLDWTQLMPNGDLTSINSENLRFYRCVLSEVRRRGIQPVVTLYNPSYRSPSLGIPEHLHANGGWRNYSTVEAFVKYATFCYREFGALVPVWITINEPNRLTEAYSGTAEDRRTVARHLLTAHAKAWRVYDKQFRQQQGATVSFALHADWVEPANPFLESHKVAAQHFLFYELGRFLDPLLSSGDSRINEGSGSSRTSPIGFSDDERAELKGAMDFIALNHFTTRLVVPQQPPSPRNPNPSKPPNQDHNCFLMPDPTWLSSHLGQAVVPRGLRRMLGWVKNRYGHGSPIIITASGVDDQASYDDQLRQSYIRDYLQEALKARELDSINLQGFYIWKLQDHHDLQFGLFSSVAHHSRPKASVYLYRDIITHRGFPSTADIRPFPCQLTDNRTSCQLCMQITENKPLLFFSVCVSISVCMLSVLIIITVMMRRRRRRTPMYVKPQRLGAEQRFPMKRVAYRTGHLCQ